MKYAPKNIHVSTVSVLADCVYKFLIAPISPLFTSFMVLHFHSIKFSQISIWNYFLGIEHLTQSIKLIYLIWKMRIIHLFSWAPG